MCDNVLGKCHAFLQQYRDRSVKIQAIDDELSQLTIDLSEDFQLEIIARSTDLAVDELLVANIHDIRLIQILAPNEDDRWIGFQQFFNRLIQESNSSNTLGCIVLLLQEHLTNMSRFQQYQTRDKHIDAIGERL